MESDSPLMVYVARTLLDGSLLRVLTPGDGDGINSPKPRTPQKLFEQRVALTGFLPLLAQDRDLWPMVEQHVQQTAAMREQQARMAAEKSRQSLDASQSQPSPPKQPHAVPRVATPASDEFTRQRMARFAEERNQSPLTVTEPQSPNGREPGE